MNLEIFARRSGLFIFVWFGFLVMAFAQSVDRPNIVFIVADDLGYTDLGCYGNPFNETAHIDSLAQSGLRFTQAYSSSPVCSPSRAGILTGIHPARLHLTNFLVGERSDPGSPVLPAEWKKFLPSRMTTIAEFLQGFGYECGMVGKWHLGTADSLLPSSQGFNYERMIAKNGLDYYNYTITSRNRTVFEDRGENYLTDKLSDYGVDFISANRDKPFFLYLAYSAPHVMLVPRADKLRKYFFKYERFSGKYNPNYAAMIESMDEGVGRILQTLRDLDMEKKTLVIFTSDNGGVAMAELGPTPTNLEPFRAWKGHVYEGGIKVPLIIRWPGNTPAGQVNTNYVINTDFFPTISDILKEASPVPFGDGKSMLPTLLEPQKHYDRGPVFWHYPHFSNQMGRPSGAMRNGSFKIVENYERGTFELFDLAADKEEKNDLSKNQPERLKMMSNEFRAWQKEVEANMPRRNQAFKK